MTIDQLISELQMVREILGGETVVCEDEGGVNPGGPVQGLQGQVDVMPGDPKTARKCVVLIGNLSRLTRSLHG